MAFGSKIRELRTDKKLSVNELASRIEKTPAYVSRIEVRGEIPSPEMIFKLAKVLGGEAGELIDMAKGEKGNQLRQNAERKYDEALALYRKTSKTRAK